MPGILQKKEGIKELTYKEIAANEEKFCKKGKPCVSGFSFFAPTKAQAAVIYTVKNGKGRLRCLKKSAILFL